MAANSVDDLSISITSSAEKANNAIDSIISRLKTLSERLQTTTKNVDFESIAKSAKNIDLSGIEKSTRSVQAQIQSAGKSVEKSLKRVSDMTAEFESRYKDLGKNFQFFGTEKKLDSEIIKYSNALEKAKLKKEALIAKGAVSSESYGDAIKDVQMYTNILDNLKKKKEELASASVSTPQKQQKYIEVEPNHWVLEELAKNLEPIKTQAEEMAQSVTDSFNKMTAPLNNANDSLENFSETMAKTGQYTPGYTPLADFARHTGEASNTLDENLAKIAERINELKNRFKEAGTNLEFTGNTEQLDKEIQRLEADYERMYAKMDRQLDLGQIDTKSFETTIYDLQRISNQLDILETKRPDALNRTFEENAEKVRETSRRVEEFEKHLRNLQVPEIKEDNLNKLQNMLKKAEQNLENLRVKMENALSGGKVKADIDDKGFTSLLEQIGLAEKRTEALKTRIAEVSGTGGAAGIQRLGQTISGIAAYAKKASAAFSALYGILSKINGVVNKVFSYLGKLAKSLHSTTKASNSSNMSFKKAFTTLLKYGFGIRSIYLLVNKLRNAIKEGMKNLVLYSDETNASVSMLRNSLTQLKNATAAAIAPLLNAIAPALNTLIQLFIRATNAINQFISALLGNSTWIRAKEVTDNYRDSLAGVAKAADDVMKGIRAFDELKVINLPDDTSSGSDGGTNAADMFETLPVESRFQELAEKIKDIMRQLFAPLKAAWENEGEFVMKSWRSALDNIWKLTKSIGKDFLEMWQQQKTVDLFSDILHIVGDIGAAISHIAENLRTAWEANDVGLRIFENIRDIFAAIMHNIRLAADYTVEWTSGLNFSPVLEAFERFTASLIPAVDNLSGVLSDFYTMVLLPLGKWVLEKGLPDLLDVFTSFNEKVDWESLRANLAEFWAHLEPFAETVGEGLILFIERISDALADFLNSQEFKDFLVSIENWMDKVTPEDVANGLEKVAKALIALKAALIGFAAIKGIASVLSVLGAFVPLLKPLLGFLPKIGGALSTFGSIISTAFTETILPALSSAGSAIAGFFSTFGATILTVLGTIAAGIAAAIAGWNFGQWINEKITGEEIDMSFFEQMDTIKESFADGSWKEAFSLWGQDIYDSFLEIGNAESEFVSDLCSKISGFFSDLWEDIKGIWGTVTGWFSEKIITPVTNAFSNLKQNVSNFFTNLWNNIKSVWSSVSSWFTSTVINPVRNAWSTAITVISGFFTNLWSGIKSGVVSAMNMVISGINSALNGIINGINTVISGFNNIASSAAGLIGLNFGGISLIPSIQLGYIQGYKTGGFPEDGLFFANHSELVGKFSNGKTAVANNEQITAGIEQAAYQGFKRAMSEMGGFSANATFKVVGDPNGMFEVVQEKADEFFRKTGESAFAF